MKLFILFLLATLPNPRPVTEELIEDFSNQWSSSQENIVEGLELYQRINKPLISFFGGEKIHKTASHYRAAYKLAKRLAEAGCLIASAGGTGIMEAVNGGAASVKDQQLTSISIDLIRQEGVGLYAQRWLFLERASALVFFSGGIGTLDALVHVLNEIEANRMKPIPIYIIGKEEWREIQSWTAERSEIASLTTFTDSMKEVEVGILEWIVGHRPIEPTSDEQEEEED